VNSRTAPLFGGGLSAIAIVLAMFTEAVGYGMVAPTLPFMARQVGAGESRIGFLVGLYAAVGLFAAIPLGAVSIRFGRRALILLGLACVTAASIGFVFAPTYGWLVVARAVQGLGASGVWVGSLTLAADLSEDASMGRSLSWLTGAWSFGFILGPALGGMGSLRFPFAAYAGLSSVALLVGFAGLPGSRRGGEPMTLGGILRVFRRRPVLASGIATFALAFFYGAVEAFLPLLVAAGGHGRTRIGILFSIAGLPSVILPTVAGAAADRYGDRRLIVAGLLFAAALSLAFMPLYGRVPTVLLFFLLGCVEVLVYVPAVALLHRGMPSADRVFASGSHSYAFSSGFFLGPLCAGAFFPMGGFRSLFVTVAVVALAAAIGLGRIGRAIDRPEPDPSASDPSESTPPLADPAAKY
jgi:MFS family permease